MKFHEALEAVFEGSMKALRRPEWVPHTRVTTNGRHLIMNQTGDVPRSWRPSYDEILLSDWNVQDASGTWLSELPFWKPIEAAPLGVFLLVRGPWGHDVLACNPKLKLWYDRGGRLCPTPTAWARIPT